MSTAIERSARGFDALSPHYDTLVRLFAGRAIPDSQTLFLDRVGDSRCALIVGGGTGEFLVALLASRFRGRVVNLDISQGMLRRAERRVRATGITALERVEFRRGVVESLAADERFDLLCTHCFLDLFTPRRLDRVVARLDAVLEPGGTWLCSDFADPGSDRGWRAGAHRVLLRALYAMFGICCAVEPRRLPPILPALAAGGLVRDDIRKTAGGLLWSGCFRKPVRHVL